MNYDTLKRARAGQPQKYETPEAMQAQIDAYFSDCFENKEKPTITGLALYLGFASRQSLIDYEGYSSEFFDAIKKAKLFVENGYEQALHAGGGAGIIFALKNFNWKDKTEVDQTVRNLPDWLND